MTLTDHTYFRPCPSLLCSSKINDCHAKIKELEEDIAKLELEIQVMLKCRPSMSIDAIRNDKEKMLLYTSFPYDTFEIIVRTLQRFQPLNYYAGWSVTNISLENQVLITLMKLRLNLRDLDLADRFCTSRATISNEALNRAAQSEIALEFLDLPELYETIGNLDTVMNFLISVNYPADILLNSFMEETLQMKPLPSQKAAQCCKLGHVQSLWFVLTLEKTKRLHHSEKEAFDGINKSIQETLSDEQMQELDNYLNELSLEKLQIFLEQLLEFIVFSLNCGEGDISSYQYSLMESFMVHLEDPVYSDVDLKSFRPDDIQRLPVSIRSEHSVEVWKRIHRFILSRE